MVKILKAGKQLLLEYQADRSGDATWVDFKLREEGTVNLPGRTFTFMPGDLLLTEASDDMLDDDTRTFILGTLVDGYYIIRGDILGLRHDLKLYQEMRLNHKTFTAYRDISIFAKIDKLIEEPIVVGSDAEEAIPVEEFEYLLKNFPTSTELNRYAQARVKRILQDYFPTMSDAQKKLEDFFCRKKKSLEKFFDKKESPPYPIAQPLVEYELNKFEYLRSEIKEKINDEDSYDEKSWRDLIFEFIRMLFPKYIAVLKELHIRDYYSGTYRKVDLALVDADGNIDIIEIKKPFAKCILSYGVYRDNYTPHRELAGAVMQAEKYLFHLNKWGAAGEQEILKAWQSELPKGLQIKIINPKAMIILGRDNNFSEDQQRADFEIIRRNYANVIDIMTYDDLLRRLENIIAMLQRQVSLQIQGGNS